MADGQNSDQHLVPRLDLRPGENGAVIGAYVPTRADLEESRLTANPKDWPKVDLVTFDAAQQLITMSPLRTRPSFSFLKRKFPSLVAISVEVQGLVAPTSEEQAQAELYRLPEGFIYQWDWGLGVQKINKPILDAIRSRKGIKIVRLTRSAPTQITESEYILNIDDYVQLIGDMARITKVHQQDGLKERKIVAHNVLLADKDPTVRRQAMPYRRDALSELLDRPKNTLSLSPKDQRAMVRTVGDQAPEILRREPAVLARLRVELEVVTLEALIVRFETLLGRPSSEEDWQKLFETNPFILAMIFGYPVVLQRGQASVSGPGIDGRGEKITDFLVTHQLTSNCALLEIKKPSTALVSRGRDRGTPKVAQDLTNAVVQVLDQRQRFMLEFVAIKYKSRGVEMEPHHVASVVVAGTLPEAEDEKRAFEIYRNAFKDVTVLTFDEVLARLRSLRTHLTPDASDRLAPEPAPAPSYSGFMTPPSGRDEVPF